MVSNCQIVPGSNCLNFLQVFVGYQADFSWFYKIIKKPSFIEILLMQFKIIKLPIRCILNLAAIPSCEVLQVSWRRRSNFESSWDLHQFSAVSMQVNFSHIISFKVASYSACYFTNSVYLRYLLEKLTRENKVIAVVKKWKCFQF